MFSGFPINTHPCRTYCVLRWFHCSVSICPKGHLNMGEAFPCALESSGRHCACVGACVRACFCLTADCCFLRVNMTKKTLSGEEQEQGVMVYWLLPVRGLYPPPHPLVSTSPLPCLKATTREITTPVYAEAKIPTAILSPRTMTVARVPLLSNIFNIKWDLYQRWS